MEPIPSTLIINDPTHVSIKKNLSHQDKSDTTAMTEITITPRFITCTRVDPNDGNTKEFTWDKDKISVEHYLLDDTLMLQNVFEGKIISPSIYPLIYDTKSSSKEISLRSLEFYREVENDNSLYKTLAKEDKIYFLIGLRDLFVASNRHLLTKDEEDILLKMVDLVDPNDDDEDIVYKRVNDIEVTPYPTSKNKLVRFIDDKSTSIQDEQFIRNELNLLMCFADPQDLSYHNFENIINLDSVFKNDLKFTIRPMRKHPKYDFYTFNMIDSTDILASLDKNNLYVQPLNKLSRGGQRFIFSSDKLSQLLTKEIKNAEFEEGLLNKFKFVNYVFRYNKFRPDDKKFTSHFDTPYHDPAKKHYSKYTLILYLTSGEADPFLLSVNNGKIKTNKIDTKTGLKGIIFDQKYEHEGNPFIGGDKIFLRTELVYEYGKNDNISFDNEVSKKFNIACYMTKQSVFNGELEKYASDCFNHAAEARFNMAQMKATKDVLMCKQYQGWPFVTNGYDYWFCKDIPLEDAAILLLLDHFNCTFKSRETFNKMTYDYVIPLELNKSDEIFKYLNEYSKDLVSEKKVIQAEEEEEEEEKKEIVENDSKPSGCCPVHSEYNFRPKRSGKVQYYHEEFTSRQVDKLRKFKDRFDFRIFNKKITIQKDNIQVTEKSIIFDQKIPQINFASCWSWGSPLDYISCNSHEAVGYTNIPPIEYETSEDGHHLKIELFQNGFLRKKVEYMKKFSITNDDSGRCRYDPQRSDSDASWEGSYEDYEEYY